MLRPQVYLQRGPPSGGLGGRSAAPGTRPVHQLCVPPSFRPTHTCRQPVAAAASWECWSGSLSQLSGSWGRSPAAQPAVPMTCLASPHSRRLGSPCVHPVPLGGSLNKPLPTRWPLRGCSSGGAAPRGFRVTGTSCSCGCRQGPAGLGERFPAGSLLRDSAAGHRLQPLAGVPGPHLPGVVQAVPDPQPCHSSELRVEVGAHGPH